MLNTKRLLRKSVTLVTTCFLLPCVILLAAELVVRLALGKLTSPESPRIARLLDSVSSQPDQLSTRLGWVPEEEYRSNGTSSFKSSPVIIAVGDSYTWGSGVEDCETWPAHLEQLLHIKVRNAGVGGYGFDVLRAESILSREHIYYLVVSPIADDIARCEKSFKFGRWKPYFTVHDGSLVFHEAAIEKPPPAPGQLCLNVLDHSYFAFEIMSYSLPENTVFGLSWFEPTVPCKGSTVAGLLLARLADRCAEVDTHLVVVLQGSVGISGSLASQSAAFAPLIAVAEKRKIPMLDLVSRVIEDFTNDGLQDITASDNAHLNDIGNRWVAHQIARFLSLN